jgi:RNA recognition motif-containing protein
MNTKLYVGNLSFQTNEETLKAHFSPHGAVTEVRLMTDRMTGQSRGFGFVTMETADGAQTAIRELDSRSLDGRDLTVNEARPQGETGAPRRSFSRR